MMIRMTLWSYTTLTDVTSTACFGRLLDLVLTTNRLRIRRSKVKRPLLPRRSLALPQRLVCVRSGRVSKAVRRSRMWALDVGDLLEIPCREVRGRSPTRRAARFFT
jgi:hypothetical protein